jgi:hypothetical protein
MPDLNRGSRRPQPKQTSTDNRPNETAGIAAERHVPEYDMTAFHPQYCHHCEREFAADEPVVYLGMRGSDPFAIRVGPCCRSVLSAVILREVPQ